MPSQWFVVRGKGCWIKEIHFRERTQRWMASITSEVLCGSQIWGGWRSRLFECLPSSQRHSGGKTESTPNTLKEQGKIDKDFQIRMFVGAPPLIHILFQVITVCLSLLTAVRNTYYSRTGTEFGRGILFLTDSSKRSSCSFLVVTQKCSSVCWERAFFLSFFLFWQETE